MTSPRVTIGVPVFNGERHLAEAVESVLTQTFTDLELIIFDNASTDATADMCREYEAMDRRVTYHRNVENLGAARNYNLTLEHARGTYFKWLAHDDACGPRFVEVCAEVLDNDPAAVLAYPTPVDIDGEGRRLGLRDTGLRFDDDDPVQRFRDTMGRAHACLPVFGLTRTDVLRKTGRHGNYPAADRVLLSELALWGKLVEVPVEAYFHREHEGRYVHTHTTPEEQLRWFDPSSDSNPALIEWRKLKGYSQAVGRAPISVTQRGACYARLGKWSIKKRRPLTREILQPFVQRVGRSS